MSVLFLWKILTDRKATQEGPFMHTKLLIFVLCIGAHLSVIGGCLDHNYPVTLTEYAEYGILPQIEEFRLLERPETLQFDSDSH